MIDKKFWKGKRVFITGHTGFKGSWLCLWLTKLGANVRGYSLAPPTNPSLFDLARVAELITSTTGDVRDGKRLQKCLSEAKAEIVFHLAAQPLVRDSYKIPVETYETNVMGTVNVLEAIRHSNNTVRAFVNITTDKVYENRAWLWGYRENEPLGGYDPYSNSKACSELVTAAYRDSYFNPSEHSRHRCGIATARAGNVLGGGDWATDRIVPDCIGAILDGKPIKIRNPQATRPWQHVLEPLTGYLLLAEKLYKEGAKYAESWNFGPVDEDCKTVEYLVRTICKLWESKATVSFAKSKGPHEASFLKLDCSKAGARLGWHPYWNLEKALVATVEWYKTCASRRNAREMCLKQIDEFERTAKSSIHG
jgi:CDP-glucose 4,6-dehydratase